MDECLYSFRRTCKNLLSVIGRRKSGKIQRFSFHQQLMKTGQKPENAGAVWITDFMLNEKTQSKGARADL